MGKNRKTAPDFGGKTQTASYYRNRKTAQKPREKLTKVANRTEKSTKSAKHYTSGTP